MKMTLLKGLSVLSVNLMMISCELEPYAIDTVKGELVRQKNDSIERISCYDDKLREFACFDNEDLNRIRKCIKRSGNKQGR